MRLYDNWKYLEDVEYVANLNLPWNKLNNSSILISGATGLLGSFLVDVIMNRNQKGLNCVIYALGRNEEKAKGRFQHYFFDCNFRYVCHDVNKPLNIGLIENNGYVLHLASNTHPIQYSTDPIGTITTNVFGVKNLLDFCVEHAATRFAFISSNEIYGENRGDVEKYDESYCGYIDSNTLRAGYPESKRCGEALCQAYKKQKGLDIVIPRLTRSYGPTLLASDSKALSQFLHKGMKGEDIVLKSEGTQYYSYTYVADAVAGLLTVLLLGKSGEAYNVSDEKSDIMLKDLAKIIADYAGTNVVYEIPDEIESAGYSKVTKARLDGEKLENLGWKAKYNINNGIERTMSILSDLYID